MTTEEFALYQQDYYQRNKARLCATMKAHYQTAGFKQWNRQRRRDEPKLERAAHALIANGVRTGKVIRPPRCQMCGKVCVTEAHHEDYNLPYNVWWLCDFCHRQEHRTRPIMSNTKGNRWAHDFDCCQRCGSSAHRHVRGGICRRCYDECRRSRRTLEPLTYNVGVDYEIFDLLRIKVWF